MVHFIYATMLWSKLKLSTVAPLDRSIAKSVRPCWPVCGVVQVNLAKMLVKCKSSHIYFLHLEVRIAVTMNGL